MNLISITAENFCSYKYLSFDFDAKGLCLISGDTGVGKSTLLDAVAWSLFGVTSKDGSADDVRGWDADDPTEVHTIVETPTGTLWVFRVRGPKNDLFWLEDGTGPEMRGKDLGDTQRLLEQRLGVTAEFFLIGAYLTQFSKADLFFIAKAKDRREVLEKIADQEFAIKLGDRTSEARKVAKKDAQRLEIELSGISGKLEVTEQRTRDAMVSETQWMFENIKKIDKLETKKNGFEVEQAELRVKYQKAYDTWENANIDAKIRLQININGLQMTGRPNPDAWTTIINEKKTLLDSFNKGNCSQCGAPGEYRERAHTLAEMNVLINEKQANKNALKELEAAEMEMRRLEASVNPNIALLDSIPKQNPYIDQLEALKAETNPYTAALQEAHKALGAAQSKRDTLQMSLTQTNALVASLTWLYDASFEMRGLLMARVVSQIETATNSLLEKYFDAAIRVRFVLKDSDKLEVEIMNDGHQCGFRSLSGGERTLLKLCFSLSLMKAAQDKAGIHFDQVFFDEPLAGLDPGLKVKAFGLFQQLESEHGTVLIIEHDDSFKSQFSNTYMVSKGSDGHSEIHAI